METTQTSPIEQISRPSQSKRRTEARRKAYEEMRLNPGKIVSLPPARRQRRRKKKKKKKVGNTFAEGNVVPNQEGNVMPNLGGNVVPKQEDNVVPNQEDNVTPPVVKKEELMELSTSPKDTIVPKEEILSCQESFLAFLKKWLDDRNIPSEDAEVKIENKEEIGNQED